MKGFTLLEALIVIAILAVLSTLGFGLYRNFVKSSELDLLAKEIAFDLKSVQAKSMAGEKGLKWGIHFVNVSNDYYELFSTPADYSSASTTIDIVVYLPGAAYFTDPTASSTILFNKIRGTIAATSTVSVSSPEGDIKTVTVTPVGNIY